MRLLRIAAFALAAGAAGNALAADAYPNHTITIIVPASPGGAIDIVARLISQKMTVSMGQSVVVQNKPGATGTIGEDYVAKSAPDGYTLVLAASSHAINPTMFKLPYDTVKSFEPVALTHSVPLMLVVTPGLPVKSVKELIAYGKAHPHELTFASSGPGGAPHFSGELFKSMTGIDMVHVPYKGSTAAHPDLTSGRVSMMFDTLAALHAPVSGKLVRPLAVTTTKRAPAYPDIPTMAEAGLPGYDTSTWGGVLAPAGTPAAIVNRLNAEINKALSDPDVRKTLQQASIDPVTESPQYFAKFIDTEMVKWAKVAKDANIHPE
ncbi:ABC transporter substrate-binding protein [Bordetella genomosp. 8]|uniref:ABC transporter substrate-binding protein n=1 Tax=Bordetella genomosp. 8 TaxID=1416806 RepID=A0A1W6YUQ9_9BORD|nr:tripartite tricarboxylate transporter substrate binding protein [Bordetella genomosp. 8]ARP84353.1 ABC transporter substrate-binding protein [Bordetella genomosp. 8]